MGDLLRRSGGDYAPARVTAARPHVYHVVGVRYHVEVVLDYDDSRAVFDQAAQHAGQHAHVERVQPYSRLVEDEDRVVLRAPHLGRELEPLRLAARESRSRLA